MRAKIAFILQVIFILLYVNHISFAHSSDYPKTREERRADEMGSIVGGEGLIFRPGKIRNESTKTSDTYINKHLWEAAIEEISFAPLAFTDSITGVIVTEWYSPKDKPEYSFKININIKDNVISPEALEVKIVERIRKKNVWQPVPSSSGFSRELESKILSRARELYILSGRK